MDRTLRDIREDEAKRIQAIRHLRKSLRTLLECRKPSPFLHLNRNCKQRSRELQMILCSSTSTMYLLKAYTLFVIGEARKGVRFLKR
jgi:hypothetical protein